MKNVVTAVLATSLLAPVSALASATTNIALGKPVTASSIEKDKASLAPAYAVDGNAGTRWSSEFSNHEWIMVDLEAAYQVTGVNLFWQNSYSKDYEIQVSLDGTNWSTVENVVDSDGDLDQLATSAQARFVRISGSRRATRWGHSLWEMEVHGHPLVSEIALNKSASASSIEKGQSRFSPQNAVDGNPDTRWSSEFSDHQWFAVDMGENYQLTSLKLHWQNSYSKDYDVQTSYDGETWTTVESVRNGDGGLDELTLAGHGRYVRVEGYSRATRWGHSLWEVEAYGYATASSGTDGGYTGGDKEPSTDGGNHDSGLDNDGAGQERPVVDTQAPSVPENLTTQVQGATAIALLWGAANDDEGVLSYEIYRDGEMVAELLAPVTVFLDAGLTPATGYEYQVRASDAAGNGSALSEVLSVSTVDASVISGTVRLEWATPDHRENGEYLELDEIGGYEIRYQTSAEADPVTLMVEDPYTTSYDLTVAAGVYQFSIAVYDTNGLYSEFVPIQPVP